MKTINRVIKVFFLIIIYCVLSFPIQSARWGFVAVPVEGEFYDLLNSYFVNVNGKNNRALFFGPHVSLSYLLDTNRLNDDYEGPDTKIINITTLNQALTDAIEDCSNSGISFSIDEVTYKGRTGHQVFEFKIRSRFLEALLANFTKRVAIKTPPYLHLALATNMKMVDSDKSYELTNKIREHFLTDNWREKFKSMKWKLVVYERWASPKPGQQGSPIQIQSTTPWKLSPNELVLPF